MNIARIVEELRQGNLVIAPTDTVYGILADATNPKAVEQVFDCKQRQGKALILLAADVEMLREYVAPLNDLEELIVKNYTPGKLTLLLRKNAKISDAVTCGSKFVGMRIPDNSDYVRIIRSVGRPIIATSANVSGQPVATCLAEVPDSLRQQVALVEDGGVLTGEPSSIIKVVDDQVVIYRDGETVGRMREQWPEVRFRRYFDR